MKQIAKQNLMQLKELLENIDDNHYTVKIKVLSDASIGEHLRHILEFYLMLISGSFTGIISYDKRERNYLIESDRIFAIQTINRILPGIEVLNENDNIIFEADYTVDGKNNNMIDSSIKRELAYCIEHSIHHQAIIKAGLNILGINDITEDNFGVAYSTIRNRKDSCAQ